MQISLTDLMRDAYGSIIAPTPLLLKPHEELIGPLGHAFDLQVELKYGEISTGSFRYPAWSHGQETPFYDVLVGDKLVQIDPIGVFVISEPEEEVDGVSKIKEVKLNSREYELAGKQLVFAAGTYNFWNPADQENTMLGIVASSAPNWKIGYVSPTLIGRYRTFDDTDTKALDFLQGTAQDSYGCVIIYDTYNRTINAYDTAEPVPVLPIYLSYQNLLKDGTIKELDESLITKLYVQGAEGIDIRSVNPTGDNYIYNLDYYIENGDLPDELAAKWITWQNAIFTQQQYYTSLIALRNAAIVRQTAETARLIDLQNQLATLDNTRATFLQMQMKVGKNDDTWDYFQERLDETAVEYTAIEDDVTAQKTLLAEIRAEIDIHTESILGINAQLKMANYFTDKELIILEDYFKEDSFVDNTFAVFDVDVSADDSFITTDGVAIQLQDVTWTDVPCEGGHRIASISGGTVMMVGDSNTMTANVDIGTIDHYDGMVVCSLCLGPGTYDDTSFPSGNLTVVCKGDYDDDALLDGMEKHADIITSIDASVSHTTYFYTGDASVIGSDGAVYFTRNVTEYQRYSVAQSLYDYATKEHKDIARPTYEFEIDSGNIVYEEKFKAFKDVLKLGCSCLLQLDSKLLLTPILIEVHLNFEDPEDFTLVFANQFRRPDSVNSLKDAVSDATSATRSFENSKLAYGENNNATLWVKQLIQDGYDAAIAQINAGKDNMVTIDQAGIKVDSTDGIDKIYLNNGMIALVDKRTNTVKMAMGHFYNEASGTDFVGVLADIIGGTLLAGQNLIIECPDPNGGVMQFKVDSSGVILNNGRMYMRTDVGAMGWDANHGFFAGTTDLFETTDTGFVNPVCVDDDGTLLLDEDGFPVDTNVWIGIDGQVYIRGNIYAVDGVFNGTVYANSGQFNGVVQASDFLDASGNSMLTSEGKFDAEYLDLLGINVKNSAGDTIISIDENGIRFSAAYPPITYQYSSDNSTWHDTMQSGDIYRRESFDGGTTWNAGYQFVGSDGEDGSDASVTWSSVKRALSSTAAINASIITIDSVGAPNIYGGNIYGCNIYAGEGEDAFAMMTSDSFELRLADDDENDNPRAALTATTSDVELVLGVGTSTTSGNPHGRMFVTKYSSGANVWYVTSNNEETGFDLTNDNEIIAYGALCLDSANYGSKLPSSGTEGQVFFLT